MTLRLVSRLAENVDDMAVRLADRLTAQGVPCVFDATRDTANADLIWMCGLLAARSMVNRSISARPAFAPHFEGEPGHTYRSLFVVHRDQESTLNNMFANGAWALNEADSWSGHYALMSHTRSLGLAPVAPGRIQWSGSHTQSLELVTTGESDVAPIDSSVWTWAASAFPDLHVIGETQPWPAPPLLIANSLQQRPTEIASALEGWASPGLIAMDAVGSDHCDPIWSEFQLLA